VKQLGEPRLARSAEICHRLLSAEAAAPTLLRTVFLTYATVATPVYHLVAMRTFLIIVVLLGVAATAAAGTRQPSLRLVDDGPLTVQGARFGSSQSVRITVFRAGEVVARRTVRSDSAGGFTARFAAVTLHRCDGGGTVTARSATGRFAVAKVPQVECPMPLDPP
jgi:hypothetical protein